MLRRNVLIFHLGALGDFVVTWPLALALGRVWAQSRIVYVTHGQKGALAARVLGVEHADVDSGRWHELFTDGAALPESALKMLHSAQRIYSFVAEPGDAWSRNVARLAPEAALVHLSTRFDAPDRHVSEQLLAQLATDAPAQAGMSQILRWIAQRGVLPPVTNAGPVVIHPGGGSPGKCWASERFVEVATRLRATGTAVDFILGEVELTTWPATRLEQLAQVATIHRPATLLDLLGVLTRARLFIGNDSGPGHLAGIIGVPTVSIFGAGNHQRWCPLGPRVRVVTDRSLDAIDVETVLQAAREQLQPAEAVR